MQRRPEEFPADELSPGERQEIRRMLRWFDGVVWMVAILRSTIAWLSAITVVLVVLKLFARF